MGNFDDDLTRLFADDRLELRPATGSVNRVLAGATRRRTQRIAAASVASFAAVAALVIGAVVASGNTGPDSVMPAGPTEPSEPVPTLEPSPVDPTPTPEPPADPDPEPTETADPEQTESEPTEPEPTDPEPTEPSDGDDPGLPVLDPGEGLDGVQLGMTLAELEQVPGVTITEYPEGVRTEQCYGSYESDGVRGTISVAANAPVESDDSYLVTTLAAKGQIQTPEGIAVGATVDDVRNAYPSLEQQPNFGVVDVAGMTISTTAGPVQVRWIFEGLYANGSGEGDVVGGFSLDAGQSCAS